MLTFYCGAVTGVSGGLTCLLQTSRDHLCLVASQTAAQASGRSSQVSVSCPCDSIAARDQVSLPLRLFTPCPVATILCPSSVLSSPQLSFQLSVSPLGQLMFRSH